MNSLKLIENGLIPIYENDNNEKLVNARELHNFLGIGAEFTTWIKRRIDKYEFVEDVDFTTFDNSVKAENTYKNFKEYILTLDMAKELAMVENNKQGKQVRKYFIEIERKFKEIVSSITQEDQMILQIVKSNSAQDRMYAMSNFLNYKNSQIKEKDDIILLQAPKVKMAERFIESDGLLNVGEVAKLFNERLHKTKKIGRNKFYDILREEGILIKSGKEKNNPKQQYIDAGYFELKASTYDNGYGTIKNTTITRVTQKGVDWLWKQMIKKGYIDINNDIRAS